MNKTTAFDITERGAALRTQLIGNTYTQYAYCVIRVSNVYQVKVMIERNKHLHIAYKVKVLNED